jgi:hypothetical protein
MGHAAHEVTAESHGVHFDVQVQDMAVFYAEGMLVGEVLLFCRH